MATKKVVKKAAPAKTPAAKPAKKPAAKPAAKKPEAAKPAAKPAAPKAPVKKGVRTGADGVMRGPNGRKLKPGKRVKPVFQRVSLKIAAVKRPSAPVKPVAPVPAEDPAIAAAKAIELAQSIALRLKHSAAANEPREDDESIRLARRPTTRAQGKDTVKFPVSDLKEFRKRLLDAREAALSGVNAMKATGFNEADDHEADGGDGTNQTLRLQALGQMGQINRTIQQIEEALHRIDDGTYGVCAVCGQLIRKPRLLNQPFVLTCMECQNEMERTGARR